LLTLHRYQGLLVSNYVVAEALWLQTLSEARARARQEVTSATHQTEREKADLEVRSHVLTLREGELEERLRSREKGYAELEAQIRSLTVMLRKEQANAAFAERRLTTLQIELDEIKRTKAAKRPSTRRVRRKSKAPAARAKRKSNVRLLPARKRRSS
jgi:peptidoglycan hydrolase CwlO-like protein